MHKITTDIVQLIAIPLVVTIAGSMLIYLMQSKIENLGKSRPVLLGFIASLLVVAAIGMIFIPEFVPNLKFTYASIDVPIPLLSIHPIQISVTAGHVPILVALQISSTPLLLSIATFNLPSRNNKGEYSEEAAQLEKFYLIRPAEVSFIIAIAIMTYKTTLFESKPISPSLGLYIPMLAVMGGFFLARFLAHSFPRDQNIKWQRALIVLGNALSWSGLVFVVWL